jgi:hypothetical protein
MCLQLVSRVDTVSMHAVWRLSLVVNVVTMPQTFPTDEYANMVFIFGVCDGNATATFAEYCMWYPNHRILNPKTIQRTFNTLWETGSLPSVRLHSEHDPEH